MGEKKNQEIDLVEFFKVFSRRKTQLFIIFIIIEIIMIGTFIFLNLNKYKHNVAFSPIPYNKTYASLYLNYLSSSKTVFENNFGYDYSSALSTINENTLFSGSLSFSFQSKEQDITSQIEKLKEVISRLKFIQIQQYTLQNTDIVQEQMNEMTMQLQNLIYISSQHASVSGNVELPAMNFQSEIIDGDEINSDNFSLLSYLAILSDSQKEAYIMRLTNLLKQQITYSMEHKINDFAVYNYLNNNLSDHTISKEEIITQIENYNPYYAQIIRDNGELTEITPIISTTACLSISRLIKWSVLLTGIAIVISITLIFLFELWAIVNGFWKRAQKEE